MLDNKKILDAKHITIVTTDASFANASALYTYILTLHKKVSIVSDEEINIKYSFLPWFDKVRKKQPVSSDLILIVDDDVKYMYSFLSDFKINKKMSLSLYAALCIKYRFFTSDNCDGTEFALANELVVYGADIKLVKKNIYESLSLSYIRLKSFMYQNMILKNNATVANLYVDDDLFKSSGAIMKDAEAVMFEILRMSVVKKVFLIQDNKIIKTLKKEI